MLTRVKTAEEVQAMREGGKMLAVVLQTLKKQLRVGMTTKDLALLAASELKKLGGEPAFLGYHGFTDVLCVSVNEEVVHGIPGPRVINDGDIVSMDFGVRYKGLITDGAISTIAGQAHPKNVRLVQATEAAMHAGINEVRDGVQTGDIGHAVEAVLNREKYGVVQDLVGHGVGHELHEEPDVPNYGRAHRGFYLKSGMTVAIEPMATLGTHQVYIEPDGWTVKTADGSWAAHFEHTVLVTDSGYEILTALY